MGFLQAEVGLSGFRSRVGLEAAAETSSHRSAAPKELEVVCKPILKIKVAMQLK